MFDIMKEPEPCYGFKFCEGTACKSFLDVMDNFELDPECMIRKVTNSLFHEINEDRRLHRIDGLPPINVGQFILTSGSCQSEFGIIFHGPFNSLSDAMDYAFEKLDINYFYEFSDPNFCTHLDDTVPLDD